MESERICIVAFGEAGGGKSTFCNTLTGLTAFKESRRAKCETKETIGRDGEYDGQKTFLIDTPGLGDTDRNDTPHMVAMAKYIKSTRMAQAFVIVLNYQAHRLAEKERSMFELFVSMFPGRKWYEHIAVVWSHFYPFMPEEMKEQKSERIEDFQEFMRACFPSLSPSSIAAIPQYFLDSNEARNLTQANNPSYREVRRLLAWAGQLEPLQDIVVKTGDVKIETQERWEGPSDNRTLIREQRSYELLSNGDKVNYTPWKEVFRSTTRETRVVIYDSSGGFCTIV